jgi:hypothetical protein
LGIHVITTADNQTVPKDFYNALPILMQTELKRLANAELIDIKGPCVQAAVKSYLLKFGLKT